MKAYDCEPNDLVNFEGERHRVKEICGDSVVMINLTTMREKVISKYHSLTMVERNKKTYPEGIDWRIYHVKDSGARRILKKGMTFQDAQDFKNGLSPVDGVKFIMCHGRL